MEPKDGFELLWRAKGRVLFECLDNWKVSSKIGYFNCFTVWLH